MRKKSIKRKDKHEKHNCYVEPTTVAHHKFVIRCADCGGAYVDWANEKTYEAYMSLQKDKKSSDAI